MTLRSKKFILYLNPSPLVPPNLSTILLTYMDWYKVLISIRWFLSIVPPLSPRPPEFDSWFEDFFLSNHALHDQIECNPLEIRCAFCRKLVPGGIEAFTSHIFTHLEAEGEARNSPPIPYQASLVTYHTGSYQNKHLVVENQISQRDQQPAAEVPSFRRSQGNHKQQNKPIIQYYRRRCRGKALPSKDHNHHARSPVNQPPQDVIVEVDNGSTDAEGMDLTLRL